MLKLKASGVGEVFDAVRQLSGTWNPHRSAEELWFRGDNKDRSLIPSLYRTYETECRYDEVTLFESFMALGASIGPNTNDYWDWYFLARHHGIPSRLLGWSTNVMTALFFALEPHLRGKRRHQVDKLAIKPIRKANYGHGCPVLWVLDATSLNAWSVRQRAIISVNERLDSMLPDFVSDSRRRTAGCPKCRQRRNNRGYAPPG
jgi:hypothetical protein